MPLIPIESYDPLIETSGKLYAVPYDYPPPYYVYEDIEEDAPLKEQIKWDARATKLGKELDIESWVAINQLITLPIEAWIGQDEWVRKYGLHPLVKRAIALEVERLAAKINSERNEQRRELEMEKAQLKQGLNFGASNTSFNRVFH